MVCHYRLNASGHFANENHASGELKFFQDFEIVKFDLEQKLGKLTVGAVLV